MVLSGSELELPMQPSELERGFLPCEMGALNT